MKSTKFLLALTACVIVFATCVENDPGIVTPEDEEPIPTMVGFPVGIPVTKTIGASGGTIEITGQVMVVIPAGALNNDTNISITPVTNNAPNGNGNAYRFGPDGTNFSKPVKVTFPYSLSDITQPPMTGIAFQDTDGIWYSTRKFTWDTSNKTVSTETIHFSDWATFDVIKLQCNKQRLQVNASTECILSALSRDPLIPASASGDDDIIVPLTPRFKNAFDLVIKEWRANGVPAETLGPYGKITPNGAGCTYTAPAVPPNSSKNPVDLSVKLKDILYKDPTTGTVFRDLQLFTAIEIIGDQDYTLTLALEYTGLNATSFQCGLGKYIDSTVFQITVKANDSVFLNSPIKNYSPGFTYNSLGCSCLSMTFTNGSIIEYTDFHATFDGILTYDLTSTWCGSTDRFQCEDDPVTIPGLIIPGNVESGNIDLPQGPVASIVYPWGGNGTLTVARKD